MLKAAGRRLLHEGRRRRVGALAADIAALPAADRATLAVAADLLTALALPADHPAPYGRGLSPS